MIIYRVEITIEASIEWLGWMQQVHIPAVRPTGCFSSYRIDKVVDSAAAEPVFVMQYHCRLLEEYHRYRDDFVPGLQKATLPGGNQKRKLSLSGNRILGNVSMGNKPEGVT